MPENYVAHSLACSLEFTGARQEELLGHWLLTCYLASEDHDKLQAEVGPVSYRLNAETTEEIFGTLSQLSAANQPMSPALVANELIMKLDDVGAHESARSLSCQLTFLFRARYRNHLQLVD